MSRIGKKPVPLPKGVTAKVEGQTVTVKGAKGELSLTLVDDVSVELGEAGVQVTPRNESKKARAMWGMSRSMVQNLVGGVTTGFTKNLEINGVGYRAALKSPRELQLQLGYSHEIIHPIPDGITVQVPKPTEIIISGIEKDKVGQIAAEIRKYRGPEPYQGKGVKYAGEFIYRKEGKKK
ncbi:MAG: 50S ribosomal protein L6 [Hyphomicrobiales bacterium]|nr:50S ribosomal protein L6 [Hyphomicrobiales bacterium]